MATTEQTFVVTCKVPATTLSELTLSKVGHRVSVRGPGSFRHALDLPPEADMDRIEVELYKGHLELRAPLGLT